MAPWCESCCFWLVALMSFQSSVHQENIPWHRHWVTFPAVTHHFPTIKFLSSNAKQTYLLWQDSKEQTEKTKFVLAATTELQLWVIQHTRKDTKKSKQTPVAGEPKEKPELLVPRSSLVRVVPGHWVGTAAINVFRVSLLFTYLCIVFFINLVLSFLFLKQTSKQNLSSWAQCSSQELWQWGKTWNFLLYLYHWLQVYMCNYCICTCRSIKRSTDEQNLLARVSAN